ncbi:MAG: 8-oxo-dGTP diphosphatase [Cognaticolwellia sp.]|jgi:8-oxo-dGTP diphosphatase
MRTRVSVYGLAMDHCPEQGPRVLLTQLAEHCYRPGCWTLPGGGMDFGESPEQTLMREVHEESALHATEPKLFHVHSFSEDTKRGPFQAVQIVYRIQAQGEPRVLEVDGSTGAVAWVPLSEVAALPKVPMLDVILEMLEI